MIIRRIMKTRPQGRRLTDNKLKTKQNIHVTIIYVRVLCIFIMYV